MSKSKQYDNNWQVDKTLAQCTKYMLDNDMGDVTFKLEYKADNTKQDPVLIKAFKTLLKARSPVFYTMFAKDEDKQSSNTVLDIDDVEPKAFKQLLKFMYTDEVQLSEQNVMNVMYASRKYTVTNLTKKCQAFLDETFTSRTTLGYLEQSLLLGDKDLKDRILKQIMDEASLVLKSAEFVTLSKGALQQILQLELKVANEMEVFEACVRWATKKCEQQQKTVNGANLRAVLGGNLFLIRFPTMSVDQFNDIVCPLQVLNAKEGFDVLRYFTAKSKPSSLSFPTIQRFVCVGKYPSEKFHAETSLHSRIGIAVPSGTQSKMRSSIPSMISSVSSIPSYKPTKITKPATTVNTAPTLVQALSATTDSPSVPPTSRILQEITQSSSAAKQSLPAASSHAATAGKMLIVPGPYVFVDCAVRNTDVCTKRSVLKCNVSKSIRVKRIFLHGLEVQGPLCHNVTVVLERNGRELFRYNGSPTFIPETPEISNHFAVDVSGGVLAEKGPLDVDIQLLVSCTLQCVADRRYTCIFEGSSPSARKLDDHYVSIIFDPVKPNLLLGIEYGRTH